METRQQLVLEKLFVAIQLSVLLVIIESHMNYIN